LPYLFGAAELIDNQDVTKPEDGIKDLLVEKWGDKYMYLACIK
jgi:hypothetical protein